MKDWTHHRGLGHSVNLFTTHYHCPVFRIFLYPQVNAIVNHCTSALHAGNNLFCQSFEVNGKR